MLCLPNRTYSAATFCRNRNRAFRAQCCQRGLLRCFFSFQRGRGVLIRCSSVDCICLFSKTKKPSNLHLLFLSVSIDRKGQSLFPHLPSSNFLINWMHPPILVSSLQYNLGHRLVKSINYHHLVVLLLNLGYCVQVGCRAF